MEETQANLAVWDVGGREALRSATLKSLYLKNVPFKALIYVVNVSVDGNSLIKSRDCFHQLLNEALIQGGDCKIIALAYNNKPQQ